MKQFIVPTIAVAALLLAGCSRRNEQTKGAAASPESSTRPNTNAPPAVSLDQATQTRMNLETAALVATNISQEVQGFGQVLNPASLSSLVSEYAAARATADASQKELERIRTLAGQNNASPRALQAAEAAAARDQASTAASRQNLLAHWGSSIVRRPDLDTFVQSLADGETALVQLSLPAGEKSESRPVGARLIPISGEAVEAKFIGPAATVDPELQGQGFFFVATNSGLLKPGAAMTGWLKVSGEPIAGVVVPESAVVRFQETAWVYLETGGTNFTRTRIVLNRRLDSQDSWFVTEGLKPGDRIVVHGAESLLSEEQKSQIPLED